LTTEPIPIAPAAHYFLGGVATDVDGRTSIASLYAAGECAATGVHGANRLAGNSLAEAVVFGRRAALAMASEGHSQAVESTEDTDALDARVTTIDPAAWDRLRDAMASGAGLSRSASSLAHARHEIETIGASGPDALRRAATTAALICRA